MKLSNLIGAPWLALAAAFLVAGAGSAAAQTTPPPAPPKQPVPAQPAPPAIEEGTSGHKGVIKPPAGIDPEIQTQAPNPNPDPTGKSVITPEELPPDGKPAPKAK